MSDRVPSDAEVIEGAADELESTIIGNDAEAHRRTEMCAALRRLAQIKSAHPGVTHDAKGRAMQVNEKQVWQRCRCWQFGRCLADCPSADLTVPGSLLWWDRRANEWVTEDEAIARDVERSEARGD